MVKVMVYCNKKEYKMKLFQLLPLLNRYNFFFLENYQDFIEDFGAIRPEYLLMEDQIFETLKEDHVCLSSMSECSQLIIIKHDDSEIILPSKITPVFLSHDFSPNDLSRALVPSAKLRNEWAAMDMKIENDFLQMLMDNIPDKIYFKDRESRFTRINNAKARALSLEDPGEAIGKTDGDFFDADRAKKALDDEKKLMKTGIPIINKIERFESEGKERFVAATKIPVKDQSGNIVGLVGISRDVTKDKKYEERLLREQNLLKALMNNIPDKIFFKDRKSRFIRVNRAWANKYNLVNPDEVVGKADADFFPKEFAEETFREEQLLMETGLPLINKLEKKVRDGKASYKLVSKVPIRGKNGLITGLVGISHDVTDLKVAEEKLAHEKKLLQLLMDNIPDLIYFKDKDSKFTRINEALAFFLGIDSPEEAIGKTDFDYFPEDQTEAVFNDEQEIFRSGAPIINHLEKVTPPGKSSVWISATKIPVRDEKGHIIGLVGVSRDITIMEMARENLKYAKEKAEESNKAKSQFLANMSHEIRTPMNGVIGMADILSYTNLTQEQQTYLDIIIKSGNSLISIINDILDLSKIESDNLTLEKAPISIRGIMEDVADILIVAANNKDLVLANYIDPLIPEFVEGDSVRVRQILINLVNNAIKFTSKGEVYFSAELEESTNDCIKILFKIRDSGIGISKKAQDSLFQPFTQVDNSATRKYEGTGLGLAISKKLTEMMGGAIDVESEEGKGSLFWFNACFGIGNEMVPAAKSSTITEKELNILIVDDNKTNRFIFSKYLEIWNCKHQEADNPQTAFKMLIEATEKGKPFNIAMLDYQMPGMDGLALAEMIKADQRISNTLLILLSSISGVILPNQVREKGFESFLNKPVKLKDLYSVISLLTGSEEKKSLSQRLRETEVSANLRILIAEDNPINVKVAELIAKPFSASMEIVENGQLAYDKFIETEYDLILMDLQMPVLDGYKATKMIRGYEMSNNRVPVKVVAMTANAMIEDYELCMSIGFDDYLTKPFRKEDMIRILKKLGLINPLSER